MTDTITKVREHYNAMDLTSRIRSALRSIAAEDQTLGSISSLHSISSTPEAYSPPPTSLPPPGSNRRAACSTSAAAFGGPALVLDDGAPGLPSPLAQFEQSIIKAILGAAANSRRRWQPSDVKCLLEQH